MTPNTNHEETAIVSDEAFEQAKAAEADAQSALCAMQDRHAEIKAGLQREEWSLINKVYVAREAVTQMVLQRQSSLPKCTMDQLYGRSRTTMIRMVILKKSSGQGKVLTVAQMGSQLEETFKWDDDLKTFVSGSGQRKLALANVPEHFIPKAPTATASTDEAASPPPRKNRP